MVNLRCCAFSFVCKSLCVVLMWLYHMELAAHYVFRAFHLITRLQVTQTQKALMVQGVNSLKGAVCKIWQDLLGRV